MDWGAEYIGTILLIVGALLALWKRKRRFDRINLFGVEQFQGYWRKLGARTLDASLGFASFGLLAAGIMILAFRFEDSWGWAALLPVYLLGLFLVIGS